MVFEVVFYFHKSNFSLELSHISRQPPIQFFLVSHGRNHFQKNKETEVGNKITPPETPQVIFFGSSCCDDDDDDEISTLTWYYSAFYFLLLLSPSLWWCVINVPTVCKLYAYSAHSVRCY